MKRVDIKAILRDPIKRQKLAAALERHIRSIPKDGTHVVPPSQVSQ